MKILNVAALACCVTLLRTGWATPPLDTIERIVPGCRATVSKDARISAMTEFNFPSNTVVTVSRVEGNRGFFKVVQFGGTMEAFCLLEHMTRVYSDEEQKLLLEKRKLDMERARISAQQTEWDKQRKEREATQASKQGRIEGTVTFSWVVPGEASNLRGRMDEVGNFRGTVNVVNSRRPNAWLTIFRKGVKGGAPIQTTPDATGRFALALDPGDYFIYCQTEQQPGGWMGSNRKSCEVKVEADKTANCSFSF